MTQRQRAAEVTRASSAAAQPPFAPPTNQIMAPNPSDQSTGAVLFTEDEVAKHNTKQDCWIIVGNDSNGGRKVYDVTDYLDDHPGGCEVILDVAGGDADDMFEDIGHSKDARQKLKTFYKGDLKPTDGAKKPTQQVQTQEKKSGLSPMAVLVLLVAIAVGLFFWK